jgi:inhibitor of cysteine peptidase
MGLSSVCAARPASSARLRERRFVMHVARMHQKFAASSWLLLAALFLLAFCPALARAATKVVTNADNGKTVTIKMGDVLEVRLNANPTTGYMWYLEKQSTPLLKPSGQTQTQPPQGVLGAPVVQIFDYATTGKGTGVLLLHYVRSWMNPDPNEQQFSLHVTIE